MEENECYLLSTKSPKPDHRLFLQEEKEKRNIFDIQVDDDINKTFILRLISG